MIQRLKNYIQRIWNFASIFFEKLQYVSILAILLLGLWNWLLAEVAKNNLDPILTIIGFSFTLCGLTLIGSLFESKAIEKEPDDTLVRKRNLINSSRIFFISGLAFILFIASWNINVSNQSYMIKELKYVLMNLVFFGGIVSFSTGLVSLYIVLDELFNEYENAVVAKKLE